MPGVELHADFDRDGRVTGLAGERAARLQWPGVVVVPNMDRDERRLPSSAGNAPETRPDYDLAPARPRDDELVALRVRAAAGAMQPGDRLLIRCSGIMHTRVALHDASGVVIPHKLGTPQVYELPAMPASGVLNLTLQVRTIAGGAFGVTSSLDLTYRTDPREESRFELTLLRRAASGIENEADRGRFTVAPFILADRLAPAIRVYMVNNFWNWPSFSDVWDAAVAAAVPLIGVDPDLTHGDTWLQDQYQHSLMQGSDGWRQLIVHLPRLRYDNTDATKIDNLEEFVNAHFRSRNIGLYRDLWDRVVPVETAAGGVARPSFRHLDAWVQKAGRLLRAGRLLNRYGMDAGSGWRTLNYADWVAALLSLRADLAKFAKHIDQARVNATAERDRQLLAEKAAARAVVDAALAEFDVPDRTETDPRITSTIGNGMVTLRASIARRLYARAKQMHSGMNYGGNIESTPPVSGAPLGKIVIGNATNPDTKGEFIDPDLLRVFAKQKKQPLVEIDTSWLRVGHVDEMMAVVPHGRGRSGFSILHASAHAAIDLLARAEARYRDALPATHPMAGPREAPSGVMPRLMTDGTAPVTRLFRGKAWEHLHRAARSGQVEFMSEPPAIYFRLCSAFGATSGGTGFNVHNIGYVPGVGPDRRYPADITPTELLFAEADRSGRSSNESFDVNFLEPSRNILRNALPGIAILPVPVLFDRTDDTSHFRQFYWREQTTAFSPHMVNLKILNGHLLVPKPYGPRMRVNDAIAVVRDSIASLGVPGRIRAHVGRRLIARRRMTRARYWVEKVSPAYLTSSTAYGGMQTKVDVVNAFRDSFPGADAPERERRIIRPNLRHFDARGNLKDEFSLIKFDDGMVDLFELFVAAIAEELGVRLHFVDSWYYHLGHGEIHCGTNVLRRARGAGAGLPDVWDAPDHDFRRQPMRAYGTG